MSVPAEEMARRRVPVARPAVQQLALPPPTAAPPSQLGTPPPTTVPPSGNTVMVDSAGRASVSNIQPRAPATSGGMADFGGQAGRAARAANAATGLPGGSTLAPGSTVYVDPAGTARAGVQLGEAGQRARAAAGAPQVGPTRAAAAALGAQPAAPAAAAPAGSTAFRAGQTAGNAARALSDITGTAARLGTAPVPSAPGRLSGIGIDATARGTPRAGTGGFLAGTGILSALDSLGTPTEDYALRTGIQNTGVGTELANRTLGTLSDFGAALVDTGVWAGNKLGQGVQAVWPGAPEALTRQMPYLRDQFTDVQARANGLGVMEGYQQPSAAALAAAPPLPGQAPAADFSNVTASVSGGGGATPSGRGRSLGTFTGEVFEGEEVARSPNARGTFNVIPAYQGTAAQQLGTAPARRDQGFVIPRDNGRGTIERIDRAIADIGPLDRRGRRQAVVDLLGLRNRVESGDADRTSAEQRAAADVAQRTAASELAAAVDREQIEATSQNVRRQNTQTITDASGTTYAVNGTTLTPLTTPDGQPFRSATRTDNTIQNLAAELLQSSMASGPVEDPNAAAQQAAAAARALQSAVQGGGAGAAASLEQFMSAARQANPGVSDDQLRAYYNQNYGR